MNRNRRSFLQGLATLAGASTASASTQQAPVTTTGDRPARSPSGPVVRVVTSDVPHAPFALDNGVKVFTLRAQPVKTQFIPGRQVDAWGFDGSVPGPTIEVTGNDRGRGRLTT